MLVPPARRLFPGNGSVAPAPQARGAQDAGRRGGGVRGPPVRGTRLPRTHRPSSPGRYPEWSEQPGPPRAHQSLVILLRWCREGEKEKRDSSGRAGSKIYLGAMEPVDSEPSSHAFVFPFGIRICQKSTYPLHV